MCFTHKCEHMCHTHVCACVWHEFLICATKLIHLWYCRHAFYKRFLSTSKSPHTHDHIHKIQDSMTHLKKNTEYIKIYNCMITYLQNNGYLSILRTQNYNTQNTWLNKYKQTKKKKRGESAGITDVPDLFVNGKKQLVGCYSKISCVS